MVKTPTLMKFPIWGGRNVVSSCIDKWVDKEAYMCYTRGMITISTREFQAHASIYLKEFTEKGEEITLTRYNLPVAKIVPLEATNSAQAESIKSSNTQ